MVVLLLVASCSTGDPGSDTSAPPARVPSAPESEAPDLEPSKTPACAEVRAGIAAFNDADYEETVARFVAALPLAEEQVDGSADADRLLEAVRWYAELAPEDYAKASVSSPAFAEYKAVTLGQCLPLGDVASEDPGVPA